MKTPRVLSVFFLGVLALVAFPPCVQAQCPPKTAVSDTLYNADGSLASGRVVVRLSAWAAMPATPTPARAA